MKYDICILAFNYFPFHCGILHFFFFLDNIWTLILSQSRFESLEQEVKEFNVNKQSLKKNLLDLKELHHILRCSSQRQSRGP